ncbi:protein RTF1 homolog [Euphorbia lathyris]|uniref:protein RTF1 homolog n=1 Tax=Euphorbia lathyris TaxID=212925 RepID=UPI003313E43E
MADLENLLLEAAGRTSKGGKNRNSHPPSKRRHEGSYSDGGSDSRDDSDDGRGYPSRKPSQSQVPLKKRLDPSERDDDQGSQDEGDYDDRGSNREGDSSDESDVGEDLYKDEDDRRKLAQMSELEREMILSERADKKGDKNLTERIRSKRDNEKPSRSRKETPPLQSSRGVRTSARSADRAAAKDDALNELRAKRLKQQDPEAHRKLRDASRGNSSGRGFSPIKRKRFTSASLSSSSSESESRSHSEDEGSTGDGGMADSDDDGEPGSQGPTFEDIKEITIRRSKLSKWFMEPWFDELIVGCFVRLGIGNSKTGAVYRLCLVRNVDAADPNSQYKMDNKMTHKYLNCVWGSESSAARWQMARVSDSGPTEEEYRQWVREVERSGGRMPTKQDILEKKEAIQKSNTFVYSAATVKQMLQEKKSASARPLNVAAEKDRLRRELDVAQSKQDDVEVERIKARIKELEASRQTQEKDAKAIRLAEMNRKNRVENFKNASEMKAKATGLKAGEAGYDPFSRRWTRSRNYYVGGADSEAARDVEANGTVAAEVSNGVAVGTGAAATAAALEAAAGAGKLIDTAAPIDLGTESNTLHDFELPISLIVLQKFGGAQGAQAGFMARKQRIEATIGCRVLENDGRRHTLTLTVSDYKRRRGLL